MGVPPLRKFIKPPLERTFYSAVVIHEALNYAHQTRIYKKKITSFHRHACTYTNTYVPLLSRGWAESSSATICVVSVCPTGGLLVLVCVVTLSDVCALLDCVACLVVGSKCFSDLLLLLLLLLLLFKFVWPHSLPLLQSLLS